MNIHLNNEEPEYKTGPVRGRVLVGVGMERAKEGEYCRYTLCTWYDGRTLNISKSF
jgi:hypothetical protein